VKIKMEKVPPFFRSQMTANVSFIIKNKPDALLLPASVVKDLPSGAKQVSVPGSDGKPEPREITTGIESNDKVEVLSGLQAGDKVLMSQGRYTPQQAPQS